MIAQPQTVPGVYLGPGLAPLLRANEQQYLFQQQLILAGQASIAVQLERIRAASYPNGVSFQYFFTNASGVAANPGVFELDFQTSDTDSSDASYVSIQQISTGLNASYQGRLELVSFWAKFVRAKLVSVTNSVYLSVLATH